MTEFDAEGRPLPEALADADAARPYVGIMFECCGVYARIYRASDAAAYEGRCPRCLRPVRLRIGANGVATRIFRAR